MGNPLEMKETYSSVHQPNTTAGEKRARRLERQVLGYIRRHKLVEPGQQVLAAVSGGPDSLALLAILHALQKPLGIRLHVAHFDHMLRGRRAAREDAGLVKSLAEDLGVPASFGRGDVRAYARAHKLSIEEAARELRYRFLEGVASDAGASAVAVGHTADDQAETVLMHVVRGSGLRGLVGMQPRSPWPWPTARESLVVLRPLLTLSRAQTEAYCQARGLQPCQDSTNLLLGPLRNRIRLELLPLLRRYNPRVDNALHRLAAAAAEDHAFLQEAVERMWSELAEEGGDSITLPRRQLAAVHARLRKAVLERAYHRLMGTALDLTSAHLSAMDAALTASGEKSVSLPCRLIYVATGDAFTLSRLPSAGAPTLTETPLNIPGQTIVAHWVVTAEVTTRDAFRRPYNSYEAWLDLDAVEWKLTVRSRRSGDRFVPLGMNQEKKLQDFLVDAKVPRSQRDFVPLVCAPWGIAWVVGYRLDERAKVTDATQAVVHLRFTPLAAGQAGLGGRPPARAESVVEDDESVKVQPELGQAMGLAAPPR